MLQGKVVLVFVTNQRSCEKLIREGYKFASAQNHKLRVLSILGGMDSKNIEDTALKQLSSICKALNADMQVYWGEIVINVALDYLKRNEIEHLIVGKPEKMEKGNFVYELHHAFPDMPLMIVNK